MKKLALTNLMLLFAIKSVSACSYLAGSSKSFSETMREINFYSAVYLILIFSLFLANIVVYDLRGKKDYFLLILIIGTALVMIPVTFFGIALEECDFLLDILKLEFIIFAALFCFHLCLWLTKKSFPTLGIDKKEMISLKLQ